MINVVMHSRVSSSIWITDRVRMGSENKWIRLAAMYSILLLYSLYDTEHIDWWLPSLFTWTKTLAIHSYRPGFIIPHPDLRNGYERMVTIIRSQMHCGMSCKCMVMS
eukprot:534523_1